MRTYVDTFLDTAEATAVVLASDERTVVRVKQGGESVKLFLEGSAHDRATFLRTLANAATAAAHDLRVAEVAEQRRAQLRTVGCLSPAVR